MSAADVCLGPTLDRHYSDVGGRRQQRLTLHRRRRPTSTDADTTPTLHPTSAANIGGCRHCSDTVLTSARADTQADVGVRHRPEADTAQTLPPTSKQCRPTVEHCLLIWSRNGSKQQEWATLQQNSSH